jgi:hypothetical protein
MGKKCAILQSSYIPWKGYFDMINLVDEFILYDCVQFTRRDWRNRNKIKTPRGAEWLTIPVESKGNYHARIDEITVSDKGWSKAHWETIRHNYSKSCCFEEYREIFEKTYLTINTAHLSEVNRIFLQLICDVLNIDTKLTSATQYVVDGDKNMRLISLCQQAGADIYYSGPAAKSYVDETLFRANGIEVVWMNYDGYPEYQQLHPPFDHHVTVLDLLFNEGLSARHFMNSFKQQNLSS